MTTWDALKDELGPKTIRAEITTSYGRTVTVPIVTLSYHEWVAIGLEVPDPPVPRTLINKAGEKLPNRDDVTYLEALNRVTSDRNHRRLARAMEKAGVTIPGSTNADKSRQLQETLDAGIAARLIMLLGEAAMGGKARLLEQADTFRPGDAPVDDSPEAA